SVIRNRTMRPSGSGSVISAAARDASVALDRRSRTASRSTVQEVAARIPGANEGPADFQRRSASGVPEFEHRTTALAASAAVAKARFMTVAPFGDAPGILVAPPS